MTSLPLFDFRELKAVQSAREALLKRLRHGGIEAHSRIRMEHKLAMLTARQIRLELELGAERDGGRHV